MDSRWLPIVLAPFMGSFLGVLVTRLPAGRPIAWVRSACDGCGRRLTAADLVPILSYVALRGRCRSCGAPIERLHLWIELAALAVAVSAATTAQDAAALWADCVLGWGLLALAWIDARTMILPDALTLPLIPAGLAATAWLDQTALVEHAIGAISGYAAFQAIAMLYRRIRGREGLGGGDAKLLAVAGAWLGLSALPWVVLLAATFGLTIAAVMRYRGHAVDATTVLPFGPFLVLAIWVVRIGQIPG